jgi:hypothetical protein
MEQLINRKNVFTIEVYKRTVDTKLKFIKINGY